MMRKFGAVAMGAVMTLTSSLAHLAGAAEPAKVEALLQRSYLDLLADPNLPKLSEKEADQLRERLQRQRKQEEKILEDEEKRLKGEIDRARKDLERLNRSASRDSDETTTLRRDLHCRIAKLEKEHHDKETQRKQAIPTRYDNLRAKLDLIELWPAKKVEIGQAVDRGAARERPLGDFEDIGVRKVGEGQDQDIRVGEEAVRDMQAYGLMPPEVEDKELQKYIQDLAARIAAHSDLKVPVRAVLLNSEEINAFALPGGRLFVNSGLMLKAETESELAGVVAHEIAHAAARHGNRLMKRANIANIIFQAAQVAGMIFTGGVLGIGTYYALQYGYYGLGMVLNLTLLGVSRDFEMEADQLGVQYAFKSGYDPDGFITFFDKMASDKGYVKATSFFRTHPAFFDRIVATMSEITYLGPRADLKVDSTEFQEMKERLRKFEQVRDREIKKRPTLTRMPQCDDPAAHFPIS